MTPRFTDESKIYRRIAKLRNRAAKAAPSDYAQRAGQYADSPARYIREHLGGYLTPQQEAICEAAIKPPYKVLVPSANNQGKTWIGAALASWHFDSFAPSTTLITAPTKQQVQDLLFKELRTLRGRVGGSAGFMPRETRLEYTHDHYVHGFTAATPDGFQGRHALNLMIMFDEATGVHSDFWDRAATMFGGHAGHSQICFYNPNDPSSPAAVAEETDEWALIRLSALEHPNILAELQGLPPPIPSAIRLVRVLQRIARECAPVPSCDVNREIDFEFPAGSGQWCRPLRPEFESQVLGRWPLLPTVSLFSPAQVNECYERSLDADYGQIISVGCDVARFGNDKTAIAVRIGQVLLHVETHAKRDTIFIAKRIAELIAMFADGDTDRIRSARVYVDDTGGYGGGVVDQLSLVGHIAIGVMMAATSPDPRYLRMRSYLWFSLNAYVVAGIVSFARLSPEMRAELRADLIAPRYRVDEQGRRLLEPKAQTKQRLKRSPDVADAVTLAFTPILHS